MRRKFRSERVVLPNGMVILFHRRLNLPLLSINAFLTVGKDQNPMDRPGLAALTARLLDEGTRSYSSEELSDLIESKGGQLSTFSERELTAVCLQLLSSELRAGLTVISEMLRCPLFPASKVAAEKERVVNHINAMNDDPQILGSQLLNQWIYAGTPLALPVLGTRESIRDVTCDELIEFHRTRYGPQNTILAVAGDAEFERLIRIVMEAFGDWENESYQVAELPHFERQEEPVRHHEARDKEQVNIFLGHLGIPRTSPDFHALQVLDIILGGGPGFSSRIPRRLRDELGLAYVTYADISGSCGLYPGRFVAFIGTSPDRSEAAISGLRHEVEHLQRDGVSRAELEMARKFLTGSFVFEFQSISSIARFLMIRELFSLEVDYLEKYPLYINAVTEDEVLRVARLYLDPVNYTTVLVGPLNTSK